MDGNWSGIEKSEDLEDKVAAEGPTHQRRYSEPVIACDSALNFSKLEYLELGESLRHLKFSNDSIRRFKARVARVSHRGADLYW